MIVTDHVMVGMHFNLVSMAVSPTDDKKGRRKSVIVR